MTLIPLEEVAQLPSPGLSAPVHVSFSSNSQLVSFLYAPPQSSSSSSSALTRELFAVELNQPLKAPQCLAQPPKEVGGNTEANLSLEEQLRRERQRQLGLGITNYAWAPKLPQLLVPLQGNLYLQQQPFAPLQLLYKKRKGGAIDPQFSPNGKWVAFVEDGEIYMVPSEIKKSENGLTDVSQEPIQLTRRENENRTNGLACFVTQEELSRYRGFWWSCDSRQIAFEEIDDSHIPKFRIMHSGNPHPTSDQSQEDHKYPFAGEPNPKRRLGIVQVNESMTESIPTPTWMSFAVDQDKEEDDFYINRVNWLPDGSLCAQKMDRLQSKISLIRFAPSLSYKPVVLLHEKSDVWINSHYLFRHLTTTSSTSPNSFRFVWGSERTGFMHLYLYEVTDDGSKSSCSLLGNLTSGEWLVESIDGINQSTQTIYVSGTYDTPLERHCYAISLDVNSSTSPVRLTKQPGVHNVVIDPNTSYMVDTYSNLDQPPTCELYTIDKASQLTLTCTLHGSVEKRASNLLANNKIPVPEMIEIPTRDGSTTLYGAIFRPDVSKYGEGPYPTLVSVYGGPHVQRITNSWTTRVEMRAQRFRDMGYLVIKVDNRGSYRRGLAFEGAIKHAMGTIEISDQVDAVNQCIKQKLTIPGRVGMYGWSYGGYMSAISLMKANDVFSLGIAGAPVTSWDGYDTCYTERYMSTPALNPAGYEEGSVMNHVSKLQPHQHLLLIHGLIDENVHFRHTARLINALISSRKYYDVLLFPEERHSPRKLQDRVYMEERIADYVSKHL